MRLLYYSRDAVRSTFVVVRRIAGMTALPSPLIQRSIGRETKNARHECFQRGDALGAKFEPCIHGVLPVWGGGGGTQGLCLSEGKGRCGARDGTEGDRDRRARDEKSLRPPCYGGPTERKRYETAVLPLWRQV